MGWPWQPWDVLDWVTLGLLAWLGLAIVLALAIGRAVRTAERREQGRLRHAPPPGRLERLLALEPAPQTTTPPAGSQDTGGSSARGQGAGGTLRHDQVTGGHPA